MVNRGYGNHTKFGFPNIKEKNTDGYRKYMVWRYHYCTFIYCNHLCITHSCITPSSKKIGRQNSGERFSCVIQSNFLEFVKVRLGIWYLSHAPLNERVWHKAFLSWVRLQGRSSHCQKYLRPCRHYPLSYLPNPSARAVYDTRSVFERSLTGLNSEFSFS